MRIIGKKKTTKPRNSLPINQNAEPKIITSDGGPAVADTRHDKGTRSLNPDLLGERRGNRIVLSDSIRQVLDPTDPSPIILAHYLQVATMEDIAAWKPKPQFYTSKERASGIHASGVISVLTRRMPSAFGLVDDLPNKMIQGEAIERHYFGFPWHANTIYQPGPITLDDIHMSPDGFTPTMDPNLLRTFPNMNWYEYQPFMLEEMKSTYYSSSKVRDGGLIRNLEFRGWLYQQGFYLYGLASMPQPYGFAHRTRPGAPLLSRLTVWWIMDDYSFRGNPPVVECWILGWDYQRLHNFWNNTVLKYKHLAAPEKH